MIVAMSKDIRVLVIKLADRLHNMRTLRYLKTATQATQGHRDAGHLRSAGASPGHEHDQVGAGGPGFATLQPKIYDEIVRLVAEQAPAEGAVSRRGDRPGRWPTCGRRSCAPRWNGRPKHYYSIYQKMVEPGFGIQRDL